jgi:glycolate oxidase
VKSPDDSMDEWHSRLPKILEDLYLTVKKLGGTISGEHGIGSKRKNYMHLVATDAELEFMKKIKRAVDPNNIMNPGKIIDV